MAIKSVSEIFNRVEEVIDANTSALKVAGTVVTVSGTKVVIQETQDLSLDILDYTTTQTKDFILKGVTLNSTDGSGTLVPITEVLNLTIIDDADTNFNTLILSENTEASSSFAFYPSSNIIIKNPSQLNITISNTNLTGFANVTLSLEVL